MLGYVGSVSREDCQRTWALSDTCLLYSRVGKGSICSRWRVDPSYLNEINEMIINRSKSHHQTNSKIHQNEHNLSQVSVM